MNSKSRTIAINNRSIGPGQPAYVVAEMSANHNQSLEQAVSIIAAAGEAGADAVKIQTYTADTMTVDCGAECFRIKGTLWEGRTLYDLYREAHTPWEWYPQLKDAAERAGVHLFSTPFDATAVDYLEKMNAPAYKIASFELVDLPLLEKVGSTGKPVIVSTGMATLAEIDEAVAALRRSGCKQTAVLKCTSAYPAPASEANLRTIAHLAEAFDACAGLSDHTLGSAVAVAAAALGAAIIEKHFTLSRRDPGPDSAFSMEPAEFAAMVKDIRSAEQAVGRISYEVSDRQRECLVFRRSLFVVKDMQAGESFTADNVRSIRPAHGLHTRCLPLVLGRRASRSIARGTPLEWTLIG